MNRKIAKRMMPFLALAMLICLAGTARGAGDVYPAGPITIQVGYPPGASAGNSAQIFAEYAKKYLPKPQPILVNFKPGAASAVAADYVSKQPADGYNLLWFPSDLATKLAEASQQLSFKLEDFISLGAVGTTPNVLVVNREKSPFTKMEQFIDYARKNPGGLSCAHTGIGSATHLSIEILQRKAGIKMNLIPFQGAAPGVTALLGGHVDAFLTSSGVVGTHVRPGGGLRVLAIFGEERWADQPDVPTCAELGYPMDRVIFFFLAAHKATPPKVVETLVTVCKKTAEDPAVKTGIAKLGFIPKYWTPKEMEQKARAEFDAAKEFYKKLGM